MSNFSLKNFKTEVARTNLARPTRFEVEIPIPTTISDVFNYKQRQLVNLFCESSAFPPQIIGVKQQRIYGPLYPRPFGVEYGGEGLPMTFYLDQQMDIKAFFDAWISKIVDPNQFFVYYPNQYAVNITLKQLNERDNSTYDVIIESAFPRSVSLIELNQGSTNQVSRITVNFAYRKWRPAHPILQRMQYPGDGVAPPAISPPGVAVPAAPRVADGIPVQTWAKNISEIKPQINGFDPNELLGPN
jgi:hypothetical protein